MTVTERNRQDFPEFTKIVDEFRRVFGQVRVKWAREGEQTIGPMPESIRAQLQAFKDKHVT